MNDLDTLGSVISEVEEKTANCWDDDVPVKALEFESLDRIRIHGEEHVLRPVAQREIACRLGIPIQYLLRCEPDLQAVNLNRWLGEERNENLFLRFDGDDVRAVFTPRYTPIDNLMVLDRLVEHGFSPDAPVQCRLDGELMMLNIPDRERAFKLDGNDEMRPGLSIVNSEVGLSSLILSAFVLRLICTNGMIAQTSVDSKYRHVSNRILDEFPAAIAQVSTDLGRQKRQWALSMESPVPDPDMTLKSFNRQFQLGKKEIAAVDWAWPKEAGGRMFNVVNTYTRAAQDTGLNAEQSCHLQRVGGAVLAMLN